MSKKSTFRFPKSHLPAGSRRITNQDGARVWLIGKREYPSLNSYYQYVQELQRKLKKKKAETKPQPVL